MAVETALDNHTFNERALHTEIMRRLSHTSPTGEEARDGGDVVAVAAWLENARGNDEVYDVLFTSTLPHPAEALIDSMFDTLDQPLTSSVPDDASRFF